jgi:hypothetical protein
MNGGFGLTIFHPFDQTYNLPPQTEMDHIALVATAIGARRGFRSCHHAIFCYKFGRIVYRVWVIKIERGAHKEISPAKVLLIIDDQEQQVLQIKRFSSCGELGENNVSH